MLDDLAVLEAEDVKADLGAEEVVVGMREDEVAVLEDANRVHLRRILGGSCLQQRAEPGEPVADRQVVLDVLVRVDDRHRPRRRSRCS